MKAARTATISWVAVMALGAAAPMVHRSAPAPVTTLDKPQVRLWYEGLARLSDDIATPAKRDLWNTVIGEGGVEDRANDALFTVRLHSDQDAVKQPLTMTATDAKGKVLAKRTFSYIVTSADGSATLPLWLRDVACAGRVTLSARIGGVTRSGYVNFDCGE